VLALTQIDDMPEQTVRRPLGVADLDHHLGAYPMHPVNTNSRNGPRSAAER
jgi:hypothetical protein